MKKILQIIYQAIDDVNKQLEVEQHISKQLETVLIGPGAVIDSLTMVNFIVTLEQLAEEKYGIDLSLSSDVALISNISRFKTIGSLADDLSKMIKNG